MRNKNKIFSQKLKEWDKQSTSVTNRLHGDEALVEQLRIKKNNKTTLQWILHIPNPKGLLYILFLTLSTHIWSRNTPM